MFVCVSLNDYIHVCVCTGCSLRSTTAVDTGPFAILALLGLQPSAIDWLAGVHLYNIISCIRCHKIQLSRESEVVQSPFEAKPHTLLCTLLASFKCA